MGRKQVGLTLGGHASSTTGRVLCNQSHSSANRNAQPAQNPTYIRIPKIGRATNLWADSLLPLQAIASAFFKKVSNTQSRHRLDHTAFRDDPPDQTRRGHVECRVSAVN